MKKIFLSLSFILSVLVSQAQVSSNRNGMTYKFTGLDYNAPISGKYFNFDSMTYGAEIGYFRYLNRSFNLGVPLRLGVVNFPTNNAVGTPLESNKFMGSLDLTAQYKFNNGYLLKEECWFAPFIFAGVGGKYLDRAEDKFDFEIPAGLGLNFRLAPGFYLQAQSEYRYSVIRQRNNLVHSAGFLFLFGGGKSANDQDDDGIEDSKDDCPTVAGKPEYNGCPDTDGDGIADKDDACQSVAGTKALKGCPDTDGDGISDKDDSCPKEAGLAKFAGCPDSDGDGIADSADACPTEAGIEKFQGCPDTDGDGIADKDDKCPKEKGIASKQGCPNRDADGDGVNDEDDKCPNKAGLAKYAGCPDTDGDGVSDDQDRCPAVAGIAANKGCPEIKKEDKTVLINAESIQFETNSAVIKATSFAKLDQVAAVLAKYPEYSMSIEGHTDSQGEDAANMSLSNARAKACFDYLVKKGANPTKLSSKGFGESVPKGDNKTAEGRSINRRVEFIPQVH
jgi:OmpA-OmpF porin, OOP family